MNAISRAHKTDTDTAKRPSRARTSAKTREAIGYIVSKGCTHEEAAKLAGMNRAALTRALQKPHTKAALEEARLQQVQAITEQKGLYKALAWKRAHEIAQTTKDERVALKAVELLTGESKAGPSVSVTVNAGGYEFVRPGQQLVEIEGTPDRASSADAVDDADIIEE